MIYSDMVWGWVVGSFLMRTTTDMEAVHFELYEYFSAILHFIMPLYVESHCITSLQNAYAFKFEIYLHITWKLSYKYWQSKYAPWCQYSCVIKKFTVSSCVSVSVSLHSTWANVYYYNPWSIKTLLVNFLNGNWNKLIICVFLVYLYLTCTHAPHC